MHFEPNQVYHIYNRGNNKQPIFFQERNYAYFLKKIRKEWKKYGHILCYCLMPNHFHIMLVPNKKACKEIVLGGKISNMQYLSKQIGITLSSYTKAINNQNNSIGNLFQKKTKAKNLKVDSVIKNNQRNIDYLSGCFFYIHQNPLKANLVGNLKNWSYSSWQDYSGNRIGSFCNKEKLFELTGLCEKDCINQNILLNETIIKGIF